MHSIDSSYKNWIKIDEYGGFFEIPAMLNNMLMIDFLAKLGFDSTELNIISDTFLTTLRSKATRVMVTFFSKILSKLANKSLASIKKEVADNVFYIESYVIAYGLYKQICENKELGIHNLKTLMCTKLSLDEIPDFSFIGLSNEKLLELCDEIEESSKTKKTEESGRHVSPNIPIQVIHFMLLFSQ